MTRLDNRCEGSNTTAITTSNTDGPNQFTAVTLTGTGSALTFSNTQKKNGATSALQHLPTVAATNYLEWSALTATAQAFTRFYVYMTAYPTVITRLAAFLGAGSIRGSLSLNTTGTVRTNSSGGTQLAVTTATIPLNQWCRVEYDTTGIVSTTGNVAARLYTGSGVDSGTPVSGGNLTSTGATVGGTIDAVRFGASSSVTMTAAWDMFLDDIAYSDLAQIGPALTPRLARSITRIPILRASTF